MVSNNIADVLPEGTSGAFACCENLEEVTIGNVELEQDIFFNSENVNIHCMKNTTAYKYATDNEISYTLYDSIPAVSVAFQQDNYKMEIGDTRVISPVIEPANSTDVFTLTSENEDIISVSRVKLSGHMKFSM